MLIFIYCSESQAIRRTGLRCKCRALQAPQFEDLFALLFLALKLELASLHAPFLKKEPLLLLLNAPYKKGAVPTPTP